ncbi:hypothetical protein ACFWMS_17920 [Peribacillus butanolivorans]
MVLWLEIIKSVRPISTFFVLFVGFAVGRNPLSQKTILAIRDELYWKLLF